MREQHEELTSHPTVHFEALLVPSIPPAIDAHVAHGQ